MAGSDCAASANPESPDAKRMPRQPKAPPPAHLSPVGANETQAQPENKRCASQLVAGNGAAPANPESPGARRMPMLPKAPPPAHLRLVGADETQAQPENKRGASQPVAGNDCAASANPESPDAEMVPRQPKAPPPARPKPDAKMKPPAKCAMDIIHGYPCPATLDAKMMPTQQASSPGPLLPKPDGRPAETVGTTSKAAGESPAETVGTTSKAAGARPAETVGADETQAQPENKRSASQPVAGNACAASVNPESSSSIAKSVATLTRAGAEGQHSSTTKSQQIGARDASPDFSLSPSPTGQSDDDQIHRSDPSQLVARPVDETFMANSYCGCTWLCPSWYEGRLPNPLCGEKDICIGHVCSKFFFGLHKQAERKVLEAKGRWRIFKEFTMSDIDRTRTINGDKKTATGQPKSDEELMCDLIKHKMRFHNGEVRTWPTWQTERWAPAAPRIAEPLVRGAAWEQTRAPSDSAARYQECASGDVSADIPDDGSMWRPNDTFSNKCLAEGCAPDFENAISTLAVRDRGGQGVCIRKVSCITLGEVFYYHGEEHTYEELYWQWVKGCIVIKRRTF